MLQAGLATSLDSEQGRAGVEQTRAQLPALQTSIEQSRHALAVLTGQPPAALSVQLAAGGSVPQAADELALSIPADTLRQRPDVRAAEYQMSAALARVAQADAALAPSFRLGGSLGLSALTLGALGSGSAVVSALLASVSWPVFDGGAARAQVRAQQAALEQATVAYQTVVLTALKDVETRSSPCAVTANAWRTCAWPPSQPPMPPCWRASATAAGWWTFRSCSTPNASSSTHKTASPAPVATWAPTRCACSRRWVAVGDLGATDAVTPSSDDDLRTSRR